MICFMFIYINVLPKHFYVEISLYKRSVLSFSETRNFRLIFPDLKYLSATK